MAVQVSRISAQGFLVRFLSLATLTGTTIGMSKVITTFYALELGASAAQIGLISAAEACGMVFLTLPAGVLTDRLGSRKLYFFASLLPAVLHAALLLWADWLWLAMLRLLIGVCVPFRSVAMSALFLQRLPVLGLHRAGWFRGALMIGMLLLGPWLGGLLYGQFGGMAYLWVACSFAAMALWGRSLWQDEHYRPDRKDHRGVLHLLQQQPVLRMCCLIENLNSVTASLTGTFVVILCIEQLHWTQTQAVSLITAQGLVTVVGLFLLSRIITSLRYQYVYAGALLGAVLCLCLLGGLDSAFVLVPVMFLLSLGSSAVHLANMSRLATLVVDKGRVSGVFSLSQTLGMLFGGLFGSALTHWVGLNRLFPVWAVLLLLLSAAVFIFAKGRRAR